MPSISDPRDASGLTAADGTALVSIVYATSVAVTMLNVAPAAEPLLRQAAHLSSGQVGALYGIELAAMGLASIPAALWWGRVNASLTGRCAYAAFIVGNVLSSTHVASFERYAAARAITGFAAGSLMVLGMSTAARMRDPDRAYALITIVQLASGAFMLWALSVLAHDGRELNFLFQACTGLGVLGFLTAGSLSLSGSLKVRSPQAMPGARSTTCPTTLMSIAFAMMFNLVVGGLWSFAAEYAVAGTQPAVLARKLAWATTAGLAGAMLAFLIGNSWPRRYLLVGGYVGIALGSGWLQFVRGPEGFQAGSCIVMFAWNFCIPYVFAAIAGLDATGRLMSAANLAFAFGLALGPLLAGAFIDSLGLDALFPGVLAGLAVCAMLAQRITRPAPT